MQLNGHAAGGALTPPPAASIGNSAQPSNPQDNPNIGRNGFRKAVKSGAKGRVALIGVPGGGKSYTMLTLARALAGPEGKIAAIDTEHGSLSKYAHSPGCPPNCDDHSHFEFDVDEPDSFPTDYFLDQLTFAEENGYAVFCCDSLSHFWMGKDGALEFVDAAKRRNRDQMEGWKQFRPHEREMVERMVASPCHVIVTMRTKNDYDEIMVDGKKKRVKIGLAPVQREGLEYEFDLVCSMDDENNLIIDKTRCSAYSGERMRSVAKPNATYFQPFIQWLDGPVIQRPPRPAYTDSRTIRQDARQIDTGGHPVGTQAAADHVAQQKIAALQGQAPAPPNLTRGEMRRVAAVVRERMGEVAYLQFLGGFGVRDIDEIFRSPDKAKILYSALLAFESAQKGVA